MRLLKANCLKTLKVQHTQGFKALFNRQRVRLIKRYIRYYYYISIDL